MASVQPLPKDHAHLLRIAQRVDDTLESFQRMKSQYAAVIKKWHAMGADVKSKLAFVRTGQLAVGSSARDDVEGFPPADLFMPYLDQARFTRGVELFISAHKGLKWAAATVDTSDPPLREVVESLEDFVRSLDEIIATLSELQQRLVDRLSKSPADTPLTTDRDRLNRRIVQLWEKEEGKRRGKVTIRKKAEYDDECMKLVASIRKTKPNFRFTEDFVNNAIRGPRARYNATLGR